MLAAYTRTNKSCQETETVMEKLLTLHTGKQTYQGNLSRKNCSSVRGLNSRQRALTKTSDNKRD